MEHLSLEDDIDLFESHQHLCNSLGFEQILSYLSHVDNANVRLVCKLWDISSQFKWRNNSTLQVKLQTGDEDMNDYHISKQLTIKKMVKEVLHVNYNVPSDPFNMSEYPFRNLKLNGGDQIGIMDDVETSFWNILGPSLKSLHLNDISLTPAGIPQLHRILGELTPNLKEFIFTPSASTQYEPVTLDEIVRVIQPNLTSITIDMTTVKYSQERLDRMIMNTNAERFDAQFGVLANANAIGQAYDPVYRPVLPAEAEDWGAWVNHENDPIFPRIQMYPQFRNRDMGGAPPAPSQSLTHHMIPFDWKLLFETFPNLRKITHKFCPGIFQHWEMYAFKLIFEQFLLDQINWIRQVRNERPNTLNISSWNGGLVGDEVISKFCELLLPIRCFNGYFENVTESEFRNFVTSHQNTLKELVIPLFGDRLFKDVQNMWLPSGLTSLELDRPWGDCLDFLEHVPNLEKLIFNNIRSSEAETSFTSSFGRRGAVQPLARMNEFRCKIILNDDAFDKIAVWMPNLNKLTVGMDYKRWMIAGWAWRELGYLELVPDHWDERFFLSEKLFIRFADRYEKLKEFAILKVLDDENIQQPTHFGDLSIYKGFLKMPELQSIKIKFSPEVSDEAIAALKKKIPHVCI